jgi:thermospermine synthase
MGGGEGSAAREVLRHNTVQRVVMCDIDQVRIISMHAALALLHPWRNGNHAVLAARVRVSPSAIANKAYVDGSSEQEVVDFCRTYLSANWGAFASDKLCLVINDARAELEQRQEKFDVIVGDLADPVEDGPCYQLYTKSFYQHVVKPKLTHRGIFVTQAHTIIPLPLQSPPRSSLSSPEYISTYLSPHYMKLILID